MEIDKYVDWLFTLCEQIESENQGIIPEIYRKNAFLPNAGEREYLQKQISDDIQRLSEGLESTITSSVLSELEILENEYKNIWQLDLKFKQYFIEGKPIQLSESDNYKDVIFAFRREVGSIRFDRYLASRIEYLKALPEANRDRLVWIGSKVDLTSLITELVNKGAIDRPMLGEHPNISRLANQVLNAFTTKDGELSYHTIKAGLDPNSTKQKKASK